MGKAERILHGSLHKARTATGEQVRRFVVRKAGNEERGEIRGKKFQDEIEGLENRGIRARK